MRAIALHPDVLVVTSALMQVNCVIVRGEVEGAQGGEAFMIDSPVLPDELEALPALLEQAQFPTPSGLLATHGDWDHLLGRLAFPGVALGCAESTAERMRAAPGEAQRKLRAFDEDLLIKRVQPLALGAVQTLPTPGRCDLGDHQLELHSAVGHTGDGMAIVVPWAGVLVASDYLSSVELPVLDESGSLEGYLQTLERLRSVVARARHIVPGHGPVLDQECALELLAEDHAYVSSLRDRRTDTRLPAGRDSPAQRRLHERNLLQSAVK